MASNDQSRWRDLKAPGHLGKLTIKRKDQSEHQILKGVTGIYWQTRDIVIYQHGTGRPTRIRRSLVVKMLCE
jgi:hypothetical protein